MPRRASGPTTVFVLACSVFWTGCGTSHQVCPAVSNATCGCGPTANIACPIDYAFLLYATTTSNQILGFSINSAGSLTALPSTTGPANSESIATDFSTLQVADPSTNSVDSFVVDQVNGATTTIQGSPFSIGTSGGGPTSILVGPYGYLYATEPNGTIVGLSTASEVGAFGAPLPNSPYPAGVAPSQMAFAAQGDSGTFFLYASDPGDPNGGILAYSLDSSGALTPLQGSPFPTLPNADPSSVLFAPYYPSPGTQGTQFLVVSLSGLAKVAVFAIDSTAGGLTAVPGSPFSVGNGPATLAADTSNHVFVMNATDHTVSAFALVSNGVLTAIGSPVPVGTASGGMTHASSYASEELFIADTTASTIWMLNIDPTSGQFTSSGVAQPVSSPPLQLAFLGP